MKIDQIFDGIMQGTLVPRYHAGVGMIQVYLREDLRLHVWHPDLPAVPEAFGCRHSHRFNLESTVLLGAIHNLSLDLEPSFYTGKAKTYTVVPAHKGDTSDPVADDISYNVVVRDIRRYGPGDTYEVDRGHFHETRAEGLTVTIMVKTNQMDTYAKIIGYPGQKPVHAMANPPSEVLLKQLVFSALRKLPPESIKILEDF